MHCCSQGSLSHRWMPGSINLGEKVAVFLSGALTKSCLDIWQARHSFGSMSSLWHEWQKGQAQPQNKWCVYFMKAGRPEYYYNIISILFFTEHFQNRWAQSWAVNRLNNIAPVFSVEDFQRNSGVKSLNICLLCNLPPPPPQAHCCLASIQKGS